MVFLLTVALTSSFITIQNSRPTQAESLLYNVTCTVRGLLSADCPPKNQQPSPTQETQTSPPPETGTSPTGNQPNDTSQPVEMNPELLTTLPTITEVEPILFGSDAENFVLPSVRGVNSMVTGVLGAADTAALSPSSHGWSIVGIAWYWWLLVIAGIVGLYVAAKLFISKPFIGVVK